MRPSKPPTPWDVDFQRVQLPTAPALGFGAYGVVAGAKFHAPAVEEAGCEPRHTALLPDAEFPPPYDVAIKKNVSIFDSARKAQMLLREILILKSLKGHLEL